MGHCPMACHRSLSIQSYLLEEQLEPCLFRMFTYFSQDVGCAGHGGVMLTWAAHTLKWKWCSWAQVRS